MKKKYIVIGTLEEEFMIVFPDTTTMFHSSVAESMEVLRKGGTCCGERAFDMPNIVAAGFIDSFDNCHGKSESLGISSRGDIDTKILESGCHRYVRS